VFVVEGTQANQIGAVALELNAPDFCQPLKGDILLESFQFRIGDAGHSGFLPNILSIP